MFLYSTRNVVYRLYGNVRSAFTSLSQTNIFTFTFLLFVQKQFVETWLDSTFKRSDGQILVPKIKLQAKISKNASLIDVLILFVFENRFKENLDINRKNVSKYLGP